MQRNDNKQLFYKTVFALVIPMALQNLINVGVTSTDVIMLGKVGEKALSGASLGGQVNYIMTLIFFGLTSGAAVLTAQYWGKRDLESIATVFSIALKFAICVSLCFTVAAFCFPSQIMSIFSNDQDVIKEGVSYLRIVCFSYLFISITMVYLNIMRSVEQVLVSTVIYFISLLANIILNAIFIFGMFGLPAMGVRGAAIATVMARILECILVLIYNQKINQTIPFRLSYFKRKNPLLLKDFFLFSVPVILNELVWGAGTSANTAILGHLGSSVTAANSVAQVTRQLATVICFGISSAAAIMLGKTIGEHKEELALEYSKRFVKLSVILGLGGAIIVLIVRPIAIANLSLTSQAKDYLSMMMYVMSYFVIAQSFNTTMIVGIFRSGGDTRFGLILDTTTMWLCSILIGYLAAFVFHADVTIIYMILLSDEIIKIPLSLYRYRSKIWLRNVTR
ncbi:hypothetical protein lbkm_0509 [Lachnospiraceae bacterium KM106-2]|nr:hypothetical protein lbkm_0509 [Lachnospiraceae bacterium KM106-2]